MSLPAKPRPPALIHAAEHSAMVRPTQASVNSSRLLVSALSGFLMTSGGAGCGDSTHIEHETTGSGTIREDAGVVVGELDVDRDGVTSAQGDCDDFNNSVHPGAREYGEDGVDSDCDGEDGPALELIWASQENVDAAKEVGVDVEIKVDALKQMDTDTDGAISLEEFERVCARKAQLLGVGREGVVQFHASCAGTNACRGMVLQSWGELYEHSCKGSNACAGWSCVETAADQQRSADAAYEAGHCGHCHTPSAASEHAMETHVAAIKIPFQPKQDPETYLQDFWATRSDDYLRALIAFGAGYIAPNGFAVSNMPAAYKLLNRREIDTLIGHLRTLQVEGAQFDLPGLKAPNSMLNEPSDGG
jgi:hypothetical protein